MRLAGWFPDDSAGRRLAALLAFVFLLLPFLASDRGLDRDLGPKTLALALVVLILAAKRALRPAPLSFRAHPVVGIALAYTAWTALAVAWALNRTEALWDAARQVSLAALFLFALEAMGRADPPRARLWTARAAVAFTLAAATLGWVEAVSILRAGYSPEAAYRITGTFGHKNLFSSLMGMSLPFAAYGLARFGGAWRWTAGLAFLAGGGLILLLQTRSVWLGGALALVICLPLALAFRPAQARGWRLPGAALMLLSAGAVTLAFLPGTAVGHRLKAALQPDQNQWRLLLWRKSWDLALETPLTGVGPGNWKIAIPQRHLDEVRGAGGDLPGQETGMVRPHNDFLWVLCETGFPGFVLYLAFFAGCLVVCFQRVRSGRGTEEAAFAICLLAALAIYLADACFSFPRERIAHGAFLAVLPAGLLCSPPRPGSGAVSAGQKTGNGLLFLVMLAITVWAGIRLKAEREVRLALEARAEDRLSDVIIHLPPWVANAYPVDSYGNPVRFYSGTARFLSGDVDGAREDFAEATRAHPYYAHAWNDLGTALGIQGNQNGAVDCYRHAVAVRPEFREAWLNGAIVLARLGQRDSARAWIDHVPDYWPDPRRAVLTRALAQ